MAMKGMDVEAVTDFGNQLKTNYVQQLRQVRDDITRRVSGLVWEGSDAHDYRSNHVSQFGTDLERVASKIEELGQLAINNALAQAEVSGSL